MVSLKTQRLLPNRRTKGLLVTKRTSVTPAPPGVTPKRWVAFLDEAMGGDFELVDFLQRLCGYALTGRTHEQLLFLFWGPGGNGKGVFITIVSEVMGEYARAAPMEMFVASDAYRHETELANLRGARWVSAQESEKGRGLAESKIKALTGEDMITARFMRTDFFQFRPTHKLLLATNHKPELRGVDKAMRRRVRLVPWIVEPREVDRLLADKLRLEKAAILRWMLDGCAAWREGGLTMPTAVAAATADYLSGQDSLGQWLEEQCEVDTVPSFGDSAHRARAASLFASWKAFCESRNERPGSMNRLAEELKKKGFLPARNSAGVVYFGVGLKSQPLDEQPKSGASRLV